MGKKRTGVRRERRGSGAIGKYSRAATKSSDALSTPQLPTTTKVASAGV